MLGVAAENQLKLPSWDSIESRAALPTGFGEFMGKQGTMPFKPDSRRVYQRKYMRARVIGFYNGEFHALYLSDISRTGLGCYSPIQLLPFAAAKLWLPSGTELRVTVRSCVRVKQHCYRCGVQFAEGNGGSYEI